MVYFEKITLLNLSIILIKTGKLFEVFSGAGIDIFYIDVAPLTEKIAFPVLRLCGIRISRLGFKMMEIRGDGVGELSRLRISNSELFEFQNKIIESEAYKSIYHESWQQDRIEEYVGKGLVDGGIHDEGSVARLLFIIEVVAWHMSSHGYAESVLIAHSRAWFDIFKNYATRYRINLFRATFVSFGIFKRSFYYNAIKRYPRLYKLLKNIKYGHVFVDRAGKNISTPKVYVEGRGDVSFENNGEHSDFFWQMNSEFQKKNILYKHHSKIEKEYLESYGIHSVEEGWVLSGKCQHDYKKPQLKNNGHFRAELKAIKPILNSYNLGRSEWDSFFRAHNAKVYLTWNKYYNHHMVVADAIKGNGGISAVWQMAYDGFQNIDCRISADIAFMYSEFSWQIEKKIGSNIKYNVITGYPKDYVPPLKKKQARELRERMQANGAEKIVFVIDENSLGDERWHTGHGLQRENYSFILEKVLDTPWLGVIFKPKRASDLRKRLGWVDELLVKVEKTGRCYIYEDSGRYTTSAPPILAGLSADVCIHGHLSSGTAALECALEGLPTLLIDREGCPNSKLYELPVGKVIFKSWPETIDAVMEHFNTPQGIPGFGDWSSIIDELDPFRDGKAAYRMGTYLHWLIQGFEKGMEREEIMAEAADRYRKQWGADKVISV